MGVCRPLAGRRAAARIAVSVVSCRLDTRLGAPVWASDCRYEPRQAIS